MAFRPKDTGSWAPPPPPAQRQSSARRTGSREPTRPRSMAPSSSAGISPLSAAPRASGAASGRVTRRLYCMESPESWFEDFGEATLVCGEASIPLDPDFAAVVDTAKYHVFLTGTIPIRISRVGSRSRRVPRACERRSRRAFSGASSRNGKTSRRPVSSRSRYRRHRSCRTCRLRSMIRCQRSRAFRGRGRYRRGRMERRRPYGARGPGASALGLVEVSARHLLPLQAPPAVIVHGGAVEGTTVFSARQPNLGFAALRLRDARTDPCKTLPSPPSSRRAISRSRARWQSLSTAFIETCRSSCSSPTRQTGTSIRRRSRSRSSVSPISTSRSSNVSAFTTPSSR